MHARRTFLIASLLISATAFAQTDAQVFTFNDPNSRDTISFLLDAPLESINGLSNQVKGKITLAALKASGELRVPVSSLKTGNSVRDGHLQNERWLDAKKNPDIVVTFTDLAIPRKLEDGKPVTLTTKAKFKIRGVEKEHPIEVVATYFKESDRTKQRAPGDLLRIRANFKVPLLDHDIKRDGPLLLKVAEVAEVRVDAWGSSKF